MCHELPVCGVKVSLCLIFIGVAGLLELQGHVFSAYKETLKCFAEEWMFTESHVALVTPAVSGEPPQIRNEAFSVRAVAPSLAFSPLTLLHSLLALVGLDLLVAGDSSFSMRSFEVLPANGATCWVLSLLTQTPPISRIAFPPAC